MTLRAHRALLAGTFGLALAAGAAGAAPGRRGGKTVCPVMKHAVPNPARAVKVMVNDLPVYLCCFGCDPKLKREPAKYLTAPVKDPVTKKPFRVTAETPKMERSGRLYLFSTAETKAAFEKKAR